MLWVQRVEILYTKLSRGAPAATRRNRLPRGFAITDPRAGDYYFESYKLWESTGFVPERAAAEAAPVAPLTAHALSIRIEGDAAILGLVWSSEVGAPPRKTRLNALSIHAGQWARLVVNGRHSTHSDQYYTEETYNVAFGSELRPDVFCSGEADASLDRRAELF